LKFSMSLLPWISDFWQTTAWIAKSTLSKVSDYNTVYKLLSALCWKKTRAWFHHQQN
jgi:hypothetical protein